MPDELDTILKRAEAVSRRIDARQKAVPKLESLAKRMTAQKIKVRFTDDLPAGMVGEYRHDLKRIRLDSELIDNTNELLSTLLHECVHASKPVERGPAAEREVEAIAQKAMADLRRRMARQGLALDELI